jgi:hypothetical protein
MGVTDKLASYPGDHILTQVEAQPQVVNWLSARITGKPAPTTC